jgi:nucleotide-binding universal stress UspA family protein
MKTKPEQGNDRSSTRSGDKDCENCTRVAPTASPFKLEKILVPVDFSECSRKALQYAVPFARQFKAQMIFLHVIPVHNASGWDFEPGHLDPLLEGDLRVRIERQLSELIKQIVPARIPSRIEIRNGAPAIGIVEAARELNAGLIIMSTHGHTGRVHALIGSVAADVTRLAPCPVLVVREHERDFVPGELPSAAITDDLPQTAGAPPL